MSDLISRSALLEALEEYIEYDTFDNYKEEPLINMSFEQLEDIICSQPIVYDVDKVVKELEEVIQEHKENASKTSEMSVLVSELKMVGCYSHAIEIVKEGGRMND